MNSHNQYNVYKQDLAASNARFMSRVYFWMMIGLLLSGLVAFEVANSKEIATVVLGNRVVWFGLIIAQFGAVIALSAFFNRMSLFLTTFIYLGYAILSGLTFSAIFLVFTAASISQAFFITSFSFICLSAFGYITQKDLGPIGSFCMTGLFGVIGLMLVGLIFPSIMTNALEMTINTCCIIIFAGLTAYDTQKIKSYNMASQSQEVIQKFAIQGALMLYLDFINLFISILRLTGDRR